MMLMTYKKKLGNPVSQSRVNRKGRSYDQSARKTRSSMDGSTTLSLRTLGSGHVGSGVVRKQTNEYIK